ncbi:MAG TPA: hypothetical protein DIV80_05410 [Synergistaceae bacterium]|nr:hypothetical protein [Synergistaceae bacterium]
MEAICGRDRSETGLNELTPISWASLAPHAELTPAHTDSLMAISLGKSPISWSCFTIAITPQSTSMKPLNPIHFKHVGKDLPDLVGPSMVQSSASLTVGGNELPSGIPGVPWTGNGDDLHFVLCRHLGKILQLGPVEKGAALAERDQAMNGHAPLMPFINKRFQHPGTFDP